MITQICLFCEMVEQRLSGWSKLPDAPECSCCKKSVLVQEIRDKLLHSGLQPVMASKATIILGGETTENPWANLHFLNQQIKDLLKGITHFWKHSVPTAKCTSNFVKELQFGNPLQLQTSAFIKECQGVGYCYHTEFLEWKCWHSIDLKQCADHYLS